MNVLFVASEAYPLIKTGGLGDVVYSLPHALHAQGLDVVPAFASGLDGRAAIESTELPARC